MQLAHLREKFTIKSKGAITSEALKQALLDENPKIVHFSGHGNINGLAVEDLSGNARLITNAALANLFKLFSKSIECVVLNSCYSESQAKEIAKYIPYVIGMKNSMSDKAAIEFSIGFYQALTAGKSIEFAYELGKNSIELQDLSGSDIPVLLHLG